MPMRRSNLGRLAATLLATACDHGTSEPIATPPPGEAAPSELQPAVSGPARPDAPVALPLPKAKSHAKVPADAPRFVTVATRSDGNNASEVRLFALDGVAFAGVGSALLRLGSDGTVEHERGWARGFDDSSIELDAVAAGMMWWQTESLGGAWPEDTVAALRPQSGSRGGDETPEVYRRTNARWTRIATRERLFDWYPRSFGRWKDGSLLALKAFEPRYAHPGDESEPTPPREVAASAAAIAKQKRLVVLRGAPKAPAFGARAVQAFASLPSGEIVAAIAERKRVVMLHHDESGAPDRELALPELLPGEPIELRMHAADDAWVLGYAAAPEEGTPETPGAGILLAHFDGRAWSRVPTECAYEPHGLSIDREGSAYFICQLRLDTDTQPQALFRVRHGVLEELPTDGEPDEVIALAPDDIWVAQYTSDTAKLLHSGGSPRTQSIPTTIEAAHEVLEWAEPRPIADACRMAWLPIVAGTDTAELAKKVDAIDVGAEGLYAQVVEARVRGEAQRGVIVRILDGGAVKRVARLRTRLGDAVGSATCNGYPPVTGDTHE